MSVVEFGIENMGDRDLDAETILRNALKQSAEDGWDDVIVIGRNSKAKTIGYMLGNRNIGTNLFMVERFKAWLMS